MPTSVSTAVRTLGASPKASWNSTSITISSDHPSSDRATIAGHPARRGRLQPRRQRLLHARPSREPRHQQPSRDQQRRVPRRRPAPESARASARGRSHRRDEDQDGERQHLGAALRERAGVVDRDLARLAHATDGAGAPSGPRRRCRTRSRRSPAGPRWSRPAPGGTAADRSAPRASAPPSAAGTRRGSAGSKRPPPTARSGESATVHGFSRHSTTASRHSGTKRSAVFQCRCTTRRGYATAC